MQFRAVVVDQRLKPSVVGSIDVSMNDGNGNLIKKWDRVFTTKGEFLIYTGYLISIHIDTMIFRFNALPNISPSIFRGVCC